jgi:glycosyltransferase involved in cell wall biosynthesis
MRSAKGFEAEEVGVCARVSVVIPCYDQARFLPDAIGSVLAQAYPAYEIVVVDDGSPDDVREVVARFPGAHCLSQENRGLGAARNAGLEACSGELVVFLDADDRLLPEALSVGAETLSEHPETALVWGLNRPIDQDGRALGAVGAVSNPHVPGYVEYAELLERNVVGPPVGVMFRRSALVGAGGFSTALGGAEDYDMYLRLARSRAIYCHGSLIAEYRQHPGNMSRDQQLMLRNVLSVLDAQVPFVREDEALVRAWSRGRRHAWRLYDGAPRVEAVGDLVRSRRWGRAGLESLRLLIRHPDLFSRMLVGRLRRGMRKLTEDRPDAGSLS